MQQAKTVRHWHTRQTKVGLVPVRQHWMRYWASLSPEQRQDGKNIFLKIAFNKFMRTGNPQLGKRLLSQIQPRERLVGGLGDYRPDSDFDPVQLARGIKVEMEHTNDPQVAKEIAKDHLTEDKLYYIKLVKYVEGGD
jgi:hypothetical protein